MVKRPSEGVYRSFLHLVDSLLTVKVLTKPIGCLTRTKNTKNICLLHLDKTSFTGLNDVVSLTLVFETEISTVSFINHLWTVLLNSVGEKQKFTGKFEKKKAK